MMIANKGSSSFCVTINPERYRGMLITGNIGSGKTYALSHATIPEVIKRGEKAIILDTTGSFSSEELKKCNFPIKKSDINIVNLAEEPFYIGLTMLSNEKEELGRKLSDLLSNALEIYGSIQKSMLYDAAQYTMSDSSFELLDLLKEVHSYCFDDDGKKNESAIALDRRLTPIISNNFIALRPLNSSITTDKKVTIIQLEELDETSKRECGNIILYEIWNYIKEKSLGSVCLVIDEFQVFSLHRGSILEGMIRLERKHGLSVALATQYLADRDPEELDLLDMIETRLYLRPPDRDAKSIARTIQQDEVSTWTAILKGLIVGQAVLVGRYEVNGNISTNPLVVNIKAEDENAIQKSLKCDNTVRRKKPGLICISQKHHGGKNYV